MRKTWVRGLNFVAVNGDSADLLKFEVVNYKNDVLAVITPTI